MNILKQKSGKFVWPKTPDSSVIERKYIFYGPIALVGQEPFDIKRFDNTNIKIQYKDFKDSMKHNY